MALLIQWSDKPTDKFIRKKRYDNKQREEIPVNSLEISEKLVQISKTINSWNTSSFSMKIGYDMLANGFDRFGDTPGRSPIRR